MKDKNRLKQLVVRSSKDIDNWIEAFGDIVNWITLNWKPTTISMSKRVKMHGHTWDITIQRK